MLWLLSIKLNATINFDWPKSFMLHWQRILFLMMLSFIHRKFFNKILVVPSVHLTRGKILEYFPPIVIQCTYSEAKKGFFRENTMDDKIIFHNDGKQNYPFSRFKSLAEKFWHCLLRTNKSKLNKNMQSFFSQPIGWCNYKS